MLHDSVDTEADATDADIEADMAVELVDAIEVYETANPQLFPHLNSKVS